MQKIRNNSIYRHYKGKYYYVLNVALHSETQEELVVYQALYGEHKWWVRPLPMFLEEIDTNKEDNVNKQKHRFEFISYQIEEEKEERKKVA